MKDLFVKLAVGFVVLSALVSYIVVSEYDATAAGTPLTTQTDFEAYPTFGTFKPIQENAYQADAIPGHHIITYTTSGTISPSKGLVLLAAADITQSCSMTLIDVAPGKYLTIIQTDVGTAGHYIQTPSSGVHINLASGVYSTNAAGVSSLERIQLNAEGEGVRMFSASSTLWIAEPIGDVSGTSI